ncbi:gp53-like domain-containing protein [Acinetobacter sp. MB5]|uniref:gp53-like domain-containing protein n=1 Tax=Acinetobacter sp. MB5 TaxID=2069438 RepID=UPI000DD00D53|nr:phage tail protein [Acinetobacter sp. MB5]
MSVQFYLTDAGKAAAIDAGNLDISIKLAYIAVGSGQYDASTDAAALSSLKTQLAKYSLSGGSTQNGTLNLIAAIDSTITADIYEVGLLTTDGILFAVAAVSGSDPLFNLVNEITTIITIGLALADIDAGAVTISIDTNTSAAAQLLNEHLAADNPHPQYFVLQDGNTVNGNNTFNGDNTFAGKNSFTGKTTLKEVNITGTFTVNDKATFTEKATFDGEAEFNEPVTINNTLTADQVTTEQLNIGKGTDGDSGTKKIDFYPYGNSTSSASIQADTEGNLKLEATGEIQIGVCEKSQNGYTTLPNGLMMQWGTVDYSTRPSETLVEVIFPKEFSNACLNVQLTRKQISSSGASGDGTANLIHGSESKTGFSAWLQLIISDTASLRGFTWFAIGY